MSELVLPNHWTPRPRQQAVWDYLANGGLRASVCWHRRFGKDDVGLHHTACASQERVGAYWHLLPEQAQARKAIWQMVNPKTGMRRIDEAFPLAMRATTREDEMFIQFKNGSTWQLAGSDNYNSLVGSSPCGMVFSEYALANPAAWAYFRPILLENQGWALFISTPRGRNHFHNLHNKTALAEGWFRETLTNDDTHIFSDEAMANELRELQDEHGEVYGKSIWLQEYYCSFDAAVPGAIWADCVDRAQTTGRIVEFAINRAVPVDTGWDLGRTDDTAIWFRQMHGSQVDVIDHFASAGMDIDNEDEPEKGLVQLLLRKATQHGITYGTHYLPHDARARTLAAGGKSIWQQLQDAAKRHPVLGRFVIGKRLDRQEGIQAARKTFLHCRFHASRCENGLESLRHYHREWDPELKIYTDNPVHDWASHDADAWRTLSLSWTIPKKSSVERDPTQALLESVPACQTFGAIKTAHFRARKAARVAQMA